MFLLSLVPHVVSLGILFLYVGLDPSNDEPFARYNAISINIKFGALTKQ